VRTTTTVVISFLVSVPAAALTTVLLRSDRGESPTGDSGLEQRLDGLQADLERLEREFPELSVRLATPAGTPALSADEIRAIVAAAIEERGRSAASAPDEGAPFDVDAFVEELRTGGLDEAARAELWKRLRAPDQVDAVIAELERRVDAAPRDSMAHTELGWGYFAKMLSAATGPERGQWGQRGADALIEALRVDERNWDARYTLAQHLFYADMRGDAVRHFEMLVEQQDDRIPEERHANAYLWLGNIRADQGDAAGAGRIWAEGLRIFPRNDALRRRVAGQD
jgi:hypothetical protein